MKSLVVYSSQTGNTRKMADAVFEALPGEKHFNRLMRRLILLACRGSKC
jgi:flavodoxin